MCSEIPAHIQGQCIQTVGHPPSQTNFLQTEERQSALLSSVFIDAYGGSQTSDSQATKTPYLTIKG